MGTRPTTQSYHGLRNQGSTCYLNSTLQVLFMTKEFREAVESNPDTAGVNYHLRMLFDTLKTEMGHTNDITYLLGIKDESVSTGVTAVREAPVVFWNKYFSSHCFTGNGVGYLVWKQRDAAEYFEKILNEVHPDVSKFFKGQWRHLSTCSNRHQTRNEVCSFWTLHLSLKDSSAQPYKVIDGFHALFKTSAFNGHNMMCCGDCDARTVAVSTLKRPPLILTLVLKDKGWSYVKINRVVEIPHTLQTESSQYELYAIVDQKGSLRGGHYTAKIKSYNDHKWYEFDDSRVRQCASQENDSVIRSSSAYLLMYKKCVDEGHTTSHGAPTQQNTDQETRRKSSKETPALHPASPAHSEPTATNTYASALKSGTSFKDTKAEQQYNNQGTKDSTGMLSTNYTSAQSETRSGESEQSHRASRRSQESDGVSGCLQQESVGQVCGPHAQQNIDRKGRNKPTGETSASTAKSKVCDIVNYITNSYNSILNSSSQPVYECGYHGLWNQGFTCYLNSILQVLFMTKEFREAVESNPDTAGVNYHLRMLFDTLKTQTGHTNDITCLLGIKDVLKQHDAAEYFEKILNIVHPDVSKIFNGRLRHSSTCQEGHVTSDEVCPFWTLPLSMKDSSGQPYRVISGFNAFFKDSSFSGDNEIYCGDCAAKTEAANVSTLEDHPLILTLLLKRFEFDYRLMSYVKINGDVEIPHTLQTESSQYELYAIVDQTGSLLGGHYTARIKSYNDHKWYEFNDHRVRQCAPKEDDTVIRSSSAYLLMYKKCVDEGHTTSHGAPTQQNTDQETRRKSSKETPALHPASPGHSEPTATNTYAKSRLKSGTSCTFREDRHTYNSEANQGCTAMLSASSTSAQLGPEEAGCQNGKASAGFPYQGTPV